MTKTEEDELLLEYDLDKVILHHHHNYRNAIISMEKSIRLYLPRRDNHVARSRVKSAIRIIRTLSSTKSISVVIRKNPIDYKFYICHERSYQNAFHKKYNGFKTRRIAEITAKKRCCIVKHHKNDQLQN